ncbi:DMP19 family protein [Terrisporobacter petrolearius]|uniref:DMP19 family protein n=1 Tax=Terrisporobacter petrolearius TaxID=1460447 RepID=UPI0031CC7F4C
MSFMNKILLIFVILGAINIIILLIIKGKSKSKKIEEKETRKKGDIRVLSYDDEDLICMVENDLELKYGYGCNNLKVYQSMKITHKNVYTLLWFDTEMKNGGLGEYFFSVSNVTMNYLEKAFEDVKALELLESYKIFINKNNIEESIGYINKRSVEEYSLFMSKFNFSKFNDLYEQTDLRLLIANYIRDNIIDFSDLSEEELRILKEMEEEQKLMENN